LLVRALFCSRVRSYFCLSAKKKSLSTAGVLSEAESAGRGVADVAQIRQSDMADVEQVAEAAQIHVSDVHGGETVGPDIEKALVGQRGNFQADAGIFIAGSHARVDQVASGNLCVDKRPGVTTCRYVEVDKASAVAVRACVAPDVNVDQAAATAILIVIIRAASAGCIWGVTRGNFGLRVFNGSF
jgi:hypothetical protein